LRGVINEVYTVFINKVDAKCLENIIDVLIRPNQDYVKDMLASENDLIPEGEEEEEEEEEVE
jgi:hypothetical protein